MFQEFNRVTLCIISIIKTVWLGYWVASIIFLRLPGNIIFRSVRQVKVRPVHMPVWIDVEVIAIFSHLAVMVGSSSCTRQQVAFLELHDVVHGNCFSGIVIMDMYFFALVLEVANRCNRFCPAF